MSANYNNYERDKVAGLFDGCSLISVVYTLRHTPTNCWIELALNNPLYLLFYLVFRLFPPRRILVEIDIKKSKSFISKNTFLILHKM